ncbi:MAG: NAD(P)-dependent oxidoreductase, partial [Synergistaceae bacterium]|nr:NAD(P)-dependent oxidoreductase [Synergistaceae bacterium]
LKCFIYLNSEMGLNIKITLLSRDGIKFKEANPEFFIECNDLIGFASGDVRDFAFPRLNFDYIIHAATPVNPKLEAENSEDMVSIIVDGTKRVVEFANQCGARKLLLTSSGAVYGVQPPELKNISEDYEPAPSTAYGKGKLKAEKICTEGFQNSVIARCYAFLGPYQPLAHYAIGNFIRDGIRGDPIVINGDGRPIRSYLYSGELVIWLLKILSKGAHGRAYNVGSELEISIKDLACMVSDYFGGRPVHIAGKPDFDIPAPRYVPSTARAKEELGLTQKLTLKESLYDTIDWHKTHLQ